MFREMRRKNQQLSQKECADILEKATSGVLAVSGDDDYPYAVPLSFVYSGGKIYFHSALAGHKVDAISNNEKVSFCVVDKDDVKPEEYTTYYKSVIVFGKARILDLEKDKLETLMALSEKYLSKVSGTDKEIKRFFDNLLMIEITPEHITGKCAKELINK
ncbi:MAG: pyridoxamine 5'-phosphate oxidase family protein [Clostridiales bacterium]|nr:pyridoxamine 5'-phosphate oxidase family protein [Clostridiales bacterium]